MGYVVSALPDYTEQGVDIIYNKLFTNSAVLDAIKNNSNMMTGVKSAQTINIIATEGVWQAQACARNPSGTSTLTQRTVTVGKPKIDLSFCERALEPKFTQKALVKGSTYDSLTYNTEVIDDALQQIAKRMATAVWMGDTASVDQYLLHFNGLVKTLDADVPAGNKYSGTAWSEANSRTVLKAIAKLIIADQTVYKGGQTTIKLFMAPAMRADYVFKLSADNLYNINVNDGTAKLFVEGSTIEIVEDIGLAGTNYIYAIEPENLHGATDLENEEDKVESHYSLDDKVIYLNVEWKFGVNVAFPQRVYTYKGV